jgi:hypothetical protein
MRQPRLLRDLAWLALGLALGVLIRAGFSQPQGGQLYLGAALGVSYARLAPHDWCSSCATTYERSSRDTPAAIFAGYARGRWAAELGAGGLSRFESHNVGTLPSGPYDIRQSIETRQSYARALYMLAGEGPAAFVSLGLARVAMRNHEWGTNDPSRQFVEQRNTDVRMRPLLGLGVAWGPLRLELTHVRHVAVSHWTLEQNVTAAWIGIQTRWTN